MNALSHGLSMPGGHLADPAWRPTVALAGRWAPPDPAAIVHDPWAAPAGFPIASLLNSPWPAPDPAMRSVAMPPPAAIASVPAMPVSMSSPRPRLLVAPPPLPPPTVAPAVAPAVLDRPTLRWRIMAALAAAGAAIAGLSTLAAVVF